MATYTWTGYTVLVGRLDEIAHPDPSPLLEQWERVIAEDNRLGVLAGTQWTGAPMPAVTYRPVGRARAKTAAQKNRSPRGVFAGLGPAAAGLQNNLTSAEYRRLGGPPLAPRGIHSRVITNLHTENRWDGSNGFARGFWVEVVNTKGKEFLPFHFDGDGNLPQRDLRGVRTWGMEQATAALQVWAAHMLEGL